MTKDELRSDVLDAIIYYTKRKEGIYFEYIIEDTNVVVCPCSYYSPEQLIEHLYTGDLIDCFEYFLVFSQNNEHNFGTSSFDELIDKLFDFSIDLQDLKKEQAKLKKYYLKHRYDYDFNEEWYKKEYFMLFGYMPGKKFGKSKHESVKFKIFVEFNDVTANTVSKLKDCVKKNDFTSVYADCPEISDCSLYFDPDLPIIHISGTLIDEMLSSELTSLESKDFDNVKDLKVVVYDT